MIADLIRDVIKLDHSVTLFGPLDSQVSCEIVGPSVSVAQLRDTETRVPGATLPVLESALLDMVRTRAHEFDAIHFHTEFAHAAVMAGHRPRTLTTIHWRCDELDRQLFFRAFPDLPVAAISASQAADVPGGNLAGIVHHGIPADRYVAGPGGEGLAFLGRMTDQKRPDRAIEIARRSGRPLRLAGNVDPGNPGYFRDRVEPLLGGAIEYAGELDDAGKQELLGAAAAFLMPIDWPEPFGLVMIEAMACGTPVVAWRRGAASEIVEDGTTGFLVDTIEEAVEAVGRIHTIDRTLVRRRFEERFTSARMARDYVALYRASAGRG